MCYIFIFEYYTFHRISYNLLFVKNFTAVVLKYDIHTVVLKKARRKFFKQKKNQNFPYVYIKN